MTAVDEHPLQRRTLASSTRPSPEARAEIASHRSPRAGLKGSRTLRCFTVRGTRRAAWRGSVVVRPVPCGPSVRLR